MSRRWRPAQDPDVGAVFAPANAVGPVVFRPASAHALSRGLAALAVSRRPWRLSYDERGAADALLVSLTEMSEVASVDTASKCVSAGAGATWGAVEQYVNAEGLSLGPIPGVLWAQPIAQTLACHDLQRPSPAYGQLSDALLAVESVLPGGLLTKASVTPRRATGPDFARSVVGTDGRLGVPTEVHLQLWDDVRAPVFRAARFPSWAAAHGICRAALLAGLRAAWWRLAKVDGRVELWARFDLLEWAERFDGLVGEAAIDGAVAAEAEKAHFGPEAPRTPRYRVAAATLKTVGRIGGRHPDAVAWEIRRDGAAFYGPNPPKPQASDWDALLDVVRQTVGATP